MEPSAWSPAAKKAGESAGWARRPCWQWWSRGPARQADHVAVVHGERVQGGPEIGIGGDGLRDHAEDGIGTGQDLLRCLRAERARLPVRELIRLRQQQLANCPCRLTDQATQQAGCVAAVCADGTFRGGQTRFSPDW